MTQVTNKPTIRERLFAKISVWKFSILISLGILLVLFFLGLTIDLLSHRFKSFNLPYNFAFEEGTLVNPDDLNLANTLKYKSDEVTLRLDYKTTNVIIEKNGFVFETIPYHFFKELDNSITNPKYLLEDFTNQASDQYRSPINVSYIIHGRDSAVEMNGFSLSVKGGHFKVYKLSNGFRVEYDIATREVDRSWVPNAVETKEFMTMYNKANGEERAYLRRVYTIDETKNLIRIKTNIPSEKESLTYVYNFWVNKYNLTNEELVKRNIAVGGKNWIIKKPRFIVPVEYRLVDGDLQTTVLTDKIQELSPNVGELSLRICEINLLPNFNKVRNKELADPLHTFCFIPDGSGAIIKPHTFHGTPSFYSKPFYNSDSLQLSSVDRPDTLNTNLLPFYGTSDEKKAILADIKSGIGMAKLTTKSLKHIFKLETTYNIKAYDRYEFVKGQKINVYDKTNTVDRIVVNYYLLTTDANPLTYFDFIKKLQDIYFPGYTHQTSNNYLELEVIGAINKRQHFLGIPYYKDQVLTSYQDFLDIKKSFSSKKIIYKYSGFSSGGVNGYNQEKISRSSALGSKKQLLEIAKTETFFDTYLITHYAKKDGRFVNSRHGVRLIGGNTHTFNAPTRRDLSSELVKDNPFYLLAPNYLNDKVTSFKKRNKEYKHLALRDLGSTFLRNYTTLHTSGDEAILLQQKLINELAQDYTIMLNNPFFIHSLLANSLENIPSSSSERTIFYSSIPFYSLLVSPFIPTYTTNANLDEEQSIDQFIVNALVSNMYLKFTVSKRATDTVKDSIEFNYLYAISLQNQSLIDSINKAYDKLSSFYNKTKNLNLINHELIDKNIFLLTYSSGEKVLFNIGGTTYNNLTTLAPYSYRWI